MHHRKLLGRLCQVAYETAAELMAAAVEEVGGFRTGMVAAVQAAGDLLNLNPHVHAVVPRGGWDSEGRWVPVPSIDTGVAEKLFRHKVLSFLKREGLLSEERAELLLGWHHNSGFSVDASVKVEPEDGPGLERLARYILRPPVSLERMRWDGAAEEVAYTLKPKHGEPRGEEHLDPLDFLARLIAHVPEPKLHTLRYLGFYSNVSRGRRSRCRDTPPRPARPTDEPDCITPAERQARRRAWARLIGGVYETDPLVCCKCGGAMRIVAVILDHAVIRKILDHVRKKDSGARDPPADAHPVAAAS